MTDFTIIVPTRGRPEPLKRLVSSIVNNASDVNAFDVLIMTDDDQEIEKFAGFKHEVIKVSRGNSLVADYINPMALRAKGKYVWFLADDCEIETEDWDLVAKDAIEASGKRIFYGDTYDSTRNINNVGEFPGFPIISKESVDHLEFFFDPRIPNWGADKYTFGIYQEAGLVINMQAVKIKHHQILDDETSKNVQRVYEVNGSGSNLDFSEYINKLKAL